MAKKTAKTVDPADKFTLTRLRIDRQGYADTGQYFGVGAPVFEYENDDGSKRGHVRAYDRAAAKDKIRKMLNNPRAVFGK